MALVSVMDIYINASYRHLWVVDICLHDVCLTLRIWTLQSKGYALFILVFPGLENKYLWKKGSERRKNSIAKPKLHFKCEIHFNKKSSDDFGLVNTEAKA